MVQTSPMENVLSPKTSATAETRLRFFTSTEVAEILKMHPQVITRKLQAGEIGGYKLGKDWRVSEAQLLEFLERHSNRRGSADDNRRGSSDEERAVDTFFEAGKLKSIPVGREKREAILRHLVAKLEPQRVYEEAEINQFLSNFYPDFCTLRRELIASKLMVRKNSKYKVFTANL